MQDVTVVKYERETDGWGNYEYFYRIAIVPGGRVIKVIYVPNDTGDIQEATDKVVQEIKDYLVENNFNAVSKF